MARRRQAKPSTTELVAEYRGWEVQRGNRSDYTLRQREWAVVSLAHDRRPRHLFDLDRGDVETWLAARRGRTGKVPSRSTLNTYRNHLIAFFDFLVDRGHRADNPARETPRQQVPRALPRPTSEEVLTDAFNRAERSHDRRMFAWLALTALQGFRCIEITRLDRAGVDLEANTLRVLGKGDKERIMPLHPVTRRALIDHGLPRTGFVFTHRIGRGRGRRPYSPAYVSDQMRFFLPPGTTAHMDRHYFGTWTYRACRDLQLVRDLMGHATTAPTEGYALVDTTPSQAVVASLDPWRGGDRPRWARVDDQDGDGAPLAR